MSRFGGIPVEETKGGRFGGIPVDAQTVEEEPDLLSRAGTAIADAWRGDAAIPGARTAYDSPEFVAAQRPFRNRAGLVGSLGQAFK